MSWRAIEPSPFRAWARWAPKSWPAPPDPYLDLATQAVTWPAAESSGVTSLDGAPERLPPESGSVYLPPTAADLAGSAVELERRLAASGGELVSHRFVGGPFETRASDIDYWLDPLAAWWRGQPPAEWIGPALASGAGDASVAVAWPLVAGWTPVGDELSAWLEGIRPLRPRCVVGVAVSLSPGGRRRLVEHLGEGRFDAVFHSEPTSEHDFARLASRHGYEPLPPRPAAAPGAPRARRNLELASTLREVAELELRLGSSEAECAALLAAARHVESSGLDIAAVAREGNLAVVDWLPLTARDVIAEWVGSGTSRRLEELLRVWRGELSS